MHIRNILEHHMYLLRVCVCACGFFILVVVECDPYKYVDRQRVSICADMSFATDFTHVCYTGVHVEKKTHRHREAGTHTRTDFGCI